MKDLLRRARAVLRTSDMKISRRHLANYVKKVNQDACCTCSSIIFPHSTNRIIDLWRCRCRRRFRRKLLINFNEQTETGVFLPCKLYRDVKLRVLAMTTAAARQHQKNNDLIGGMRKNNRAARAARTSVHLFDVVCQMTSWNFLNLRFWRQGEHTTVYLLFFVYSNRVATDSFVAYS